MKRRVLAAGVVAAVLLGGGGAVAFGRTGHTAAATAPPITTAEITRGDLVDTTSVDATLTYSGERTVTSTVNGTVTWVPAAGRELRQGDALYQVDRRPVVLMYGSIPLYRTLEWGIKAGPDIRQLNRALRRLGYGSGITVGDTFTWRTAEAVRAWQKDNGLERTGRVDAAQLAFLPSSVRITSAKIAVGDPIHPGRPALTVTSTKRIVHVDLKVDQQELAKPGAPATIQIPDGKTARGKIVSVGTVAKKAAGAQTAQSPDPTIDVDIELTDTRQAGRLDRAPVTVTLERQHRSDVLSVPVEALLALREGGFGIEIIGPGGTPRIVAVTTGAYGAGRVEISGAGLTAGMKVGVAAE